MKMWILKTKVGNVLCRDVFCGYYLCDEIEALRSGNIGFSQTKSELKDTWQRWNKAHKGNKVHPVKVRMFEEVKPKLKKLKF